MKSIAALSSFLFAVCSFGADLGPQLLRLIPNDARLVTGADLGRQSKSFLSEFFRSDGGFSTYPGMTYQSIWIQGGDANAASTLRVIAGAVPSNAAIDSDALALDANTRVAGDPDSVREARHRWTVEAPLGPLALKVRTLSQSYDNWFLVVKPLAAFAGTFGTVAETGVMAHQYREDLLDSIEELSGGIRFGAIDELHVEAVFRNPEDASAVATLARWLPGILQLQAREIPMSDLLEAMEDFTVYANGKSAYLSLRISEEKARSRMEARRSRGRVQ